MPGAGEARRLLRSSRPRAIDDTADLTHAELERRDHTNEVDLRRSFGAGIKWLLVGQVVVTNIVFISYAWFGRDWDVAEEVMIAWLSATVVQVVGLAKIVTESLFNPDRTKRYATRDDSELGPAATRAYQDAVRRALARAQPPRAE